MSSSIYTVLLFNVCVKRINQSKSLWKKTSQKTNTESLFGHCHGASTRLAMVPESKPVPYVVIAYEILIFACFCAIIFGAARTCPQPELISTSISSTHYKSTVAQDKCEIVSNVVMGVGGGLAVLFYLFKYFSATTEEYLRSVQDVEKHGKSQKRLETIQNEPTPGISPEETLTQYIDNMKAAQLRVQVYVRCVHKVTTKYKRKYTDSKTGRMKIRDTTSTSYKPTFENCYDFTEGFKTIDETPFTGLDLLEAVKMTRRSRNLHVQLDSTEANTHSMKSSDYLLSWKARLYEANKHRDENTYADIRFLPTFDLVKHRIVTYGNHGLFMTSVMFWAFFIMNITSVFIYLFDMQSPTYKLDFRRTADVLDVEFKPKMAGGEKGLEEFSSN